MTAMPRVDDPPRSRTARRLTTPESPRRRFARRLGAGATVAVIAAATMSSPAFASPGQTVTDLTTITANDLVTAIVGSGVTTSNVVYTGAPEAAGTFSGLGDVGFGSGILLSSGAAATAVGPNDQSGKTGTMGSPGDADLDALVAPSGTADASVLTFDFVPTTAQLTFDYVFSSEEYSEFANSTFNDVFAFFVNGKNCALTPDGAAVSINTINGGNPLGTNAQRPELYRDNSTDTPTLDLQADGLTVVLHCNAAVNKGATNTLKLAIADTSDSSLDSTVFIKAGSVQANNPPTADAKSLTTQQAVPVGVTLTGSDPDSDPLTFTVATQPAHGTLTGTAPNITYTPATGYNGPDSFTYTANDGAATSNPATVTITVTPVTPPANTPPTADPKTVTTNQNTAAPVTLTGTDPEGSPLTFTVTTQPAHGTLTGTAPNLTYTPTTGYNGPDSFTYTANDGAATSNPATVTITVTPVTPPANTPPTADPKTVTTNQNTAAPVTLTGIDPEGSPLTFTVTTQPAHGTLTGTAPNLTYTPTTGYNGPDSFTYTANDGAATSKPATVTITVKPVTTGCQVSAPTAGKSVYLDVKKQASTLVTPKLSTTAPSLVLAFIEADGPASVSQQVTKVTGGGLSWSLVKRANQTYGTAEVWQAFSTKPLTNVQVSVTLAKKATASVTVTPFTGAAAKVGAATSGSAKSGIPTVTITPNKCNSVIWAAGLDWSNAAKPTAPSGQSLVHTFRDLCYNNVFWTQKVNSATTAAGKSVTVKTNGLTKDRWSMVAVEIPAG